MSFMLWVKTRKSQFGSPSRRFSVGGNGVGPPFTPDGMSREMREVVKWVWEGDSATGEGQDGRKVLK